jgi:transposase InsO family protein
MNGKFSRPAAEAADAHVPLGRVDLKDILCFEHQRTVTNDYATSYDDASIRIAHWMAYYNSERLHSAIWYLTPDDVFYGRTSERLAVHREKLHTACIKRREYWQTIYAAP